MLAKITGIIDTIEEDALVVDVQGVGYEVFSPSTYLLNLSVGENLTLFIQTIVKEDSIAFYGFKNIIDKKLFNLLITVQGIGPKIALVMLGKMGIEDMQKAILFEDVNLLKAIPGIGAKVAQRLINELKDKIAKIPTPLDLSTTSNTVVSRGNYNDAILVLQGLGYSYFEANKAVKSAQSVLLEDEKAETIIKEALQYFSKEN